MIALSLLFACGAPADNKPANNANASNTSTKAAPAAPTVDELFAIDQKADEAWKKGDSKYFEDMLSSKYVEVGNGKHYGKADVVKMIADGGCDIKSSSMDEPQIAKIDNDTYVLSYRETIDGTCKNASGKSEKLPSPARTVSVFIREGSSWKAAYHDQTQIIGAPATTADAAKTEAKKEEPKKDEAKTTDASAAKTDAKTAEKKDEKATANKDADAAPASEPKPDANTDALVKLHTEGWDAFKNKDAKKFGELFSSNMSMVDAGGAWVSGKDAVIKFLTETIKCEGITETKVEDGFASAVSPTVEILTLKGTANGTCNGQKNGPLYQTGVFVKEGDAWHLAFLFEKFATK